MAITDPRRESVRAREVTGVDLRNSCNAGESAHRNFDPGCRDDAENRNADSDQDGRANPNSKSTIAWIVDSSMLGIKSDHTFHQSRPLKVKY